MQLKDHHAAVVNRLSYLLFVQARLVEENHYALYLHEANARITELQMRAQSLEVSEAAAVLRADAAASQLHQHAVALASTRQDLVLAQLEKDDAVKSSDQVK